MHKKLSKNHKIAVPFCTFIIKKYKAFDTPTAERNRIIQFKFEYQNLTDT